MYSQKVPRISLMSMFWKVDKQVYKRYSVGEFISYRIVVIILLAPHQGRLKLGEFISPQLLPGQNQTDHVLWQQGEAAQVEHLSSMLVDELQDLLNQGLGALVLDITLGGGQKGANSVHIDAALHKSRTGATQFLEAIIVGGIHDT